MALSRGQINDSAARLGVDPQVLLPYANEYDGGEGQKALERRFGGGGGSGTGDFGVDKIIEAFQKRQEERNRLVNEFNTKNPFVYDEVLAAKTLEAREQLDPYYNQTLSDYLTGVERTRSRGLEDERRLLSELSVDVGNYTERSKENVQLAIEKAGEGAAQVGLFQSGIRQREEGLLRRDQGIQLGDYLGNAQRREGDITRGTQRNLEDLAREESIRVRDVNRERDVQTKLLASDLTGEAATKRAYGLQQYLGPLGEMNDDYNILTGLL